MITSSNSVANVLDGIISKIEIELQQKNGQLNTRQSEPQDTAISSKRGKLCDLTEERDLHCRICYDPNQEVPVIYPCKCKV